MMSTWYSKHVEAWNKTYCKTNFCASNWLITKIKVICLFDSFEGTIRYCYRQNYIIVVLAYEWFQAHSHCFGVFWGLRGGAKWILTTVVKDDLNKMFISYFACRWDISGRFVVEFLDPHISDQKHCHLITFFHVWNIFAGFRLSVAR